METDEDGGNLHVEPEPAFDSIPEAQPAHTVISHLAQTPDLTTEIAFTSDTVQAWRDRASHLVNRFFVPGSSAHEKESRMVSEITAAAGGSNVTIDAGIRSLTWTRVQIHGDSATVSGAGDVWASYAQWRASGYVPASPHNLVDFQVTLQHTADGAWKVSDLQWRFAPGSEP